MYDICRLVAKKWLTVPTDCNYLLYIDFKKRADGFARHAICKTFKKRKNITKIPQLIYKINTHNIGAVSC